MSATRRALVVTVSNRAAAGVYEDRGGPILVDGLAGMGFTVDLVVDDRGVAVRATARTSDRTGVEMEALTAVAVACLTVVDMTKAVDPRAVVGAVQVESKTGGKKGDWTR